MQCVLPPISDIFSDRNNNNPTVPVFVTITNEGDMQMGNCTQQPRTTINPYELQLDNFPDFYQQRPSTFSEESDYREELTPPSPPGVFRVESLGRSRKSKKRKQEPFELPTRRAFPSPTPVNLVKLHLEQNQLEMDRPFLLTPDDDSYEVQYKVDFEYFVNMDAEEKVSTLPMGDLYPVKKDAAPNWSCKLRTAPLNARSNKRRVLRSPRHYDNDRDVDGALILNVARNRPPEMGLRLSKKGREHRQFFPPSLTRKFARNPHNFININAVTQALQQNEQRLEPVITRILRQKALMRQPVAPDFDVVYRAVKDVLWLVLRIDFPPNPENANFNDGSANRCFELMNLPPRTFDAAEFAASARKLFHTASLYQYNFDTSRLGLLMRAGLTRKQAEARITKESTKLPYASGSTATKTDPQAVINALLAGSPYRRSIDGKVLRRCFK